uniref:Uncharacterized protein n=1 Tax=Panagrolaimus sp. ES5 TaxID=591445 RepID=A0AC34GSU3_9BILA
MSKAAERENTLVFLKILKNYYPQIVDRSDNLPIWEKVLTECQKRGIFMDKSAHYLAKKRWTASLGNLKVIF